MESPSGIMNLSEWSVLGKDSSEITRANSRGTSWWFYWMIEDHFDQIS